MYRLLFHIAALSVVGGMRLFTIHLQLNGLEFLFSFSELFCVCGNLHTQRERRLHAENEADMMKSLEIVDWFEAFRGSERRHFGCEIEIVDLQGLL